MTGNSNRVFYGWFVVMGCSLVALGTAGTQFSFGVFLQPMTEEFGWSRSTLSLAFGITFMLSGLLRPLAGYLADRYSPKLVALSGVALLGIMLLIVPSVQSLLQLYAVFAVMSIGLTMGVGPILTKVISSWFYARRGLTLGLNSSAGSFGALILVPTASVFLVLFDWRDAYYFLGGLALLVILPIGFYIHPKHARRRWGWSRWVTHRTCVGEEARLGRTLYRYSAATRLSKRRWGRTCSTGSPSATSFEGTR